MSPDPVPAARFPSNDRLAYYAGEKVGQALSLTELACQAESLTYMRIFRGNIFGDEGL